VAGFQGTAKVTVLERDPESAFPCMSTIMKLLEICPAEAVRCFVPHGKASRLLRTQLRVRCLGPKSRLLSREARGSGSGAAESAPPRNTRWSQRDWPQLKWMSGSAVTSPDTMCL